MSREGDHRLKQVVAEIRRAPNPQKTAVNALIDMDWLEEAPLLEALGVKALGDIPQTPYPTNGKPGPKPGSKRRKAAEPRQAPAELPAEAGRAPAPAELPAEAGRAPAPADRNRQAAREALDQMKKGLAGLEAFYAAFCIDVLSEEQENSLDEMRTQAEGYFRGYAQSAHDLAGIEYETGR